MSYTYEQKKRSNAGNNAQTHSGGAMETTIPNSARLAALESGQISPTAADKGHRVDLPEAMRAKMESSFGMDFSAVKLYESEMLGQTGAEAMAQGNEIAFAPGKLDFASQSGQARLGHELSHVASQARGEVHGNGFLLDSGLEARADREGAMAARGESVYGGDYGGAVAPLSAASAAPMAGPMQASKKGQGNQERAQPSDKHELLYESPSTGKYDSTFDWDSKKEGFGIGPRIATGLLNMREYGKNFGQNVKALFGSGKKVHMHKDLMPGIGGMIYKHAVNKRMDADMENMMKMDDEDLEIDEDDM